MIARIIALVKTINVFFFFFACLFIIVVVSYEFYKSIERDRNRNIGNSIVLVDEAVIDAPKPKFKQSFYAKYDDVYMFRVQSNRLTQTNNDESEVFGLYNKFSGKNNDFETVNFLFTRVNDVPKMLLDNNALIIEFLKQHVKNPKETRDNFRYRYSQNYHQDKHVFSVVRKDTNNDSLLDENDRIDLMSAEYDGTNVTLIAENIEKFEFIEDNLILVKQVGEVDLFVYNLSSQITDKLDTSI